MKKLSDELGALFTPSGQVRKSGALGLAQERAETIAADLDAAARLLADLERDIDDLERKRRERDRVADPAIAEELKLALKAARDDLQAGRDAEREVNDFAKTERLALGAFEKAEKTFEELRACAQRIDEATERRGVLADQLAGLDAQERECLSERDKAQATLDDLEKADERDGLVQDHLRRLAAAAAAAASLVAMERRHASLMQSAGEFIAARAVLAAIRATPADARTLEDIDRQIAVLRGTLEASAPRVEIAPSPGAREAIFLNGAPVSGATDFRATARTRIAIAGVGEITIAPPATFGETEKAKLSQLEASRTKLLAACGAADAAALRAEVIRRSEVEGKLEALRAGLAALDCKEADLPAETSALAQKIAATRAQIEDTLGDEQAPPDPASIEAKQDDLRRKRVETAGARKRLGATITGLGERLRDIGKAASAARTNAQALDAQLLKDIAVLPPAERASRLGDAGAAFAAAQGAHERAKLALDQMRERAPTPDRIAQLDARVKRQEQAVENHSTQLAAVDMFISEIKGRINARGGEGLGERVATLTDDLALAQRDAERMRARAESLELLRQTINSCYEEQREQLQAPLRKRLQPFLNDLFPKAELTLDETFAIQRIVRAGAAESFERLSDGTREQIAVLVRLAMGALLHERGEDLPIILDDALVFCDDDRIELMFDALNRAARTQQVIVLTCRGKSFRTLGGKALAIEPAPRAR
jgi:DNA repair exonuclease SbcCD ATPase subunit